MKKNITLKVAKEGYDCDDCGYSEETCCFFSSNLKKFNNVKLGSAHCCSMESAYLKDGIFYIFNELDISLPYTRLSKIAFEKSENYSNKNEALVQKVISYREYLRILNPKLDLSKYNNDIILMAKSILKSHNIILNVEVSDELLL
jgi:hypothetical protein